MHMPFYFSGSLHIYLLTAIMLFLMGIFGLIYRKSFIGMLISVELILNGAALNFMAFNKFLAPDPPVGQIITLIIMGIAAAEAAIGLSMAIAVYRSYKTIDTESVNDLRK